MIVANNARRKDIAFSSEFNEVIVISDDKIEKLGKDYKSVIARILLDKIKEEYMKRKGRSN